jgi:hypothetical protein
MRARKYMDALIVKLLIVVMLSVMNRNAGTRRLVDFLLKLFTEILAVNIIEVDYGLNANK